mmetsp:Transcript_30084/g.36741  ORF Transcript_30084/g.36741 Transcript_30084/m.36741 type:complete len:419 (+) Transcript_30084:39-1295(+)
MRVNFIAVLVFCIGVKDVLTFTVITSGTKISTALGSYPNGGLSQRQQEQARFQNSLNQFNQPGYNLRDGNYVSVDEAPRPPPNDPSTRRAERGGVGPGQSKAWYEETYSRSRQRNNPQRQYDGPPSSRNWPGQNNVGPEPATRFREPQRVDAAPFDVPRPPPPSAPMTKFRPGGGAASRQRQQPTNWYENNHSRSVSPLLRDGGSNPRSHLQGGAQRTWTPNDVYSQRSSQVHIGSAHPYSPMEAIVDYWSAPNYASRKMRVFSEDGYIRPMSVNFSNPSGGSRGYYGSVQVRNGGPMTFPMDAGMTTSPDPVQSTSYQGSAGPVQTQTVQGGSLQTFSFSSRTQAVQVDLETDGLPLMAKVEVWQGPGDARLVADCYSDDGSPWQNIVEIPGYGSTICIKNVGPIEFPIKCSCQPLN